MGRTKAETWENKLQRLAEVRYQQIEGEDRALDALSAESGLSADDLRLMLFEKFDLVWIQQDELKRRAANATGQQPELR